MNFKFDCDAPGDRPNRLSAGQAVSTNFLSEAKVVNEVCTHSSLRQQIDAFGVTVHEQAGAARFVDSRTIETKGGLRLEADKIIICTGGVNRRLPIAGFELTSTHSDAWRLTSVPPSMLVIGASATGVQVASIFNALGSRVQLFEAGPRILATEDESVSAEAAAVFREFGHGGAREFRHHRFH